MNRAVAFLDSDAGAKLVQLGVVFSLLFGIGLAVHQYQYTDCLAHYNERNARALHAREEAAKADRRALDKMVDAFVNPPPASSIEEARENARRALGDFLKNRAETDRRRSENPNPPPPSETC